METRHDNLDARSTDILKTLVRTYIVQGEPVGSETILRRSHLGLSAATIRNILARLEEAGYLHQPHTSAGRVPTDKGLRAFVDSLQGEPRVERRDESLINSYFGLDFESSGQPLERVSHLLSELSNHVGWVLAPSATHNELQHIEFVRLSAHRILAVLVTKPGIVQNRLLTLQESFTQSELDQTAQYLMVNFPGKSLSAIRAELQQRLREEKARYDDLLKNAILLCQHQELSEEAESTDVFIDGASRMADQSVFPEVEKLRELLAAFEEKTRLLRLLDECLSAPNTGIHILIGSENRGVELKNCAVITAPYAVRGNAAGSLGIIGPRRMSYARAIGMVDYMAKMVSRMLSAN